MEKETETPDYLDLDHGRFNVWVISAYLCSGILLAWHLDLTDMFSWRGFLTALVLSMAMANTTIGTRFHYAMVMGHTKKRFNHWYAAGTVLCIVLFASLRDAEYPFSWQNMATLVLIMLEMFFAFLGARLSVLERLQKGN